MNEVQTKILEILTDLNKVLSDNDVVHYMGYGTALGAIREHGFIPWDDDADLLIFRNDLPRFLKALDDLPAGKYYIQNPNDGDYQLNFFKIRMNNTTYVEKYSSRADIHHGIFVDVFIIEDFPDGLFARGLSRLIGPIEGRVSWVFFKSNSKALRKLFKGIRTVMNRIMDMIGARNGNTEITTVRTADFLKNILPRDLFGEPRYVQFEDRMLPVPERCEEYLSLRYGKDYMTPPKAEDRVNHDIVLCDTENQIDPYENEKCEIEK